MENSLETRTILPVKFFLPAAVIMILIGWGGVVFIVSQTDPNGGTRWALFFFGILAITGTFLPASAYLNRRFPSTPPPTPAVIVRQALWAGIFIAALAWLQIGRVFTPALALLLGLGLILIELLLRLRERSQWKP
jgi:hypothetical protein